MTRTFGLQRFLHDIRHRRERFRQFIGIAFVILMSASGRPTDVSFMAGVSLVLLGISARLWASGHIKKNKALATDGPYGYVRHPLYVGNIALGCGFAVASGLWWSLPLLTGILFAFYPPAIRKEDSKLHRQFQEVWVQWRKETRALIPRLTPYRSGRHGTWSFSQSLRQNGEPVIALFLAFCLYFLYLRFP